MALSNLRLFLSLPFLCLLAISLPVMADWTNRQAAIMGTRITVEVFHPQKIFAEKAIDAVMDEMRRIDKSMSPFITDSLLSSINRSAATTDVKITPELFTLLQTAQHFSELTHGAFDISFASAGFLYDYRNRIRPDTDKLSESVDTIDYHNIQLNETNHSIHFSKTGVKIDLGGIAKGHAVDRSINILKKMGIKQALVTAGGDSRVLGDRQGDAWKIGVRNPRDQNLVSVLIPLENTAISTSGDYERFFEEDGVRYHHILDPKTGDSARELQSVTIIGPDATTTDALSTSVFVLGRKKGLALINRLPDIDAILIDHTGKLFYSAELEP
ncbi:MAG: FAD:protein FMN transferase, partial [Gammaproteobacteria bacterium]